MKDNKGFSLIELVISLTIVVLVGGSIISFLVTGSNSYSSVVTNTDLQEEAQLVMNQTEDLIIGAERGINFSSGTLEIFNEKEKYEIRFDSGLKKLFYKKFTRGTGTSFTPIGDEALMAENMTDFTVGILNSKVDVTMTFENNSRTYVKKDMIALRNGSVVKVSGNVDEIYAATP